MVSRDKPNRLRSDAVRNREQLIQTARVLFAERGFDVPLEDVAQAAAVSRTTLYRHFPTREELAAEVYADNVSRIEAHARQVAEQPDGILEVFDAMLDMHLADRSLQRVLASVDIAWFTALSQRTAKALEPLVDRGRQAGIVHVDVDVEDVLTTFAMASGALADSRDPGNEDVIRRVRRLLHRGLFTSPSSAAMSA
jgi:AcrR family transcriptional regulator